MRSLVIAGFAIAIGGCSPLIRVDAKFELPKGAPDLDPKRLHVRGRVACESFNLADPEPDPPAPPPPGLTETSEQAKAGERPVFFERSSATATAQFRAASCWLALSAFYDTHADGAVNDGDYVASVPAVLVRDRGIFSGNMNSIGPVKLVPVTSAPPPSPP